MDFLEFHRTFEENLSNLRLPKDCILREPDWLPLHVPLSWQVDVVLEFQDGNHIHIWESHDRYAKLTLCRRVSWGYHYGPITATDERGYAAQGAAGDPLEIRIDTCGGHPHLHYLQREPHYSQDQISGLKIDSIYPIDFIKAVFKKRRTNKTFAQIMGFKLS